MSQLGEKCIIEKRRDRGETQGRLACNDMLPREITSCTLRTSVVSHCKVQSARAFSTALQSFESFYRLLDVGHRGPLAGKKSQGAKNDDRSGTKESQGC